MTPWLDRILGVRSLSTGGEGVTFQFAHPVPAWAWVFIVAACGGLALWTYWHLQGRRGARYALGLLRAGLLVLITALLCGPQLVRQNERIEPDCVVVMIDRSASMTIPDADAPGGGREPREQQLARALAGAGPALADLSRDRRTLLLGFDSDAYDLPATGGVPTLHPPQGRRTAIGQALEQGLRRAGSRPVAGVILVSDGRSADAVGPALLRQFEARQVPIFVVPLGSAKETADLALARVEAPAWAFVGDLVPVTVTVDRYGAADSGGRVQLVDRATGEVLDEHRLDPESPDQPLTLVARRSEAGAGEWRVQVLPDQPDLSPANNARDLSVEFADRAIRVVYIDGYPRWEYRYLKYLLVREPTVRSAAMMLAADRRFLQEGSEPLGALPRTQAEWNAIDVLILGDFRPALLSEEQMVQVRRLVSERGGGLIWLAGGSYLPTGWRGAPLADLLPFSLAADGGSTDSGGPRPWSSPVVIAPGPAAERYGLLHLGEDAQEPWPGHLSDFSLNWNLLRWAQRIEPRLVKPTAEVVAEARSAAGEAAPLLLTMRYGAGRVAYVATDETWRFRYGRGEDLPERLWIPLIRLLARESLGRTGKPAILTVTPSRAQAGQQVPVTLRLIDQALIERRAASVRVRFTRAGADSGAPRTSEVVLRPEKEDEAGASLFTGLWPAREPGEYRVEAIDPLLEGLEVATAVEVLLPDDELRTPQTDHDLLTRLAEATGGEVVPPEQFGTIPARLPNRELRLLGTPDVETLWDKAAVWVLLMLLMACEWVGRRVIKLA
jgi:hypothetical protein